MAATVTKLSGPGSVGDSTFEGVFSLALDTTDASGDIIVDLSSYFKNIASISDGGGYDDAYILRPVAPAYGTDVSATNVTIRVLDAALAAVTTTDVSVITDFRIVVKGKQAI